VIGDPVEAASRAARPRLDGLPSAGRGEDSPRSRPRQGAGNRRPARPLTEALRALRAEPGGRLPGAGAPAGAYGGLRAEILGVGGVVGVFWRFYRLIDSLRWGPPASGLQYGRDSADPTTHGGDRGA
jgi:hypothetical protein